MKVSNAISEAVECWTDRVLRPPSARRRSNGEVVSSLGVSGSQVYKPKDFIMITDTVE